MKLELGKSYVTRNKLLTSPLEATHDLKHPFKAFIPPNPKYHYFTATGLHDIRDPQGEDYDLVGEPISCDDHAYYGPTPCPHCQESEPQPETIICHQHQWKGTGTCPYCRADKIKQINPQLPPDFDPVPPSTQSWGGPDNDPPTQTPKAATDKLGLGLTLIPYHSVMALGEIFIEGLRYGKNNWRKGVNDPEYQEERLEHALRHLMLWKEGDRSENHLAKVMWFCATQLELERLENDQPQPPL